MPVIMHRLPIPLLLAAVLGSSAEAEAPGQGAPPPLKVQAVDVAWLPLPGLRVRVARVEFCKEPRGRRGATLVETTDRDGNASFHVAENQNYLISVGGEWGFEKAERCVELGKHSPDHPTAYVQLRVSVRVPKE